MQVLSANGDPPQVPALHRDEPDELSDTSFCLAPQEQMIRIKFGASAAHLPHWHRHTYQAAPPKLILERPRRVTTWRGLCCLHSRNETRNILTLRAGMHIPAKEPV
jgi:hypothetical protein